MCDLPICRTDPQNETEGEWKKGVSALEEPRERRKLPGTTPPREPPCHPADTHWFVTSDFWVHAASTPGTRR